ncbi:hypothetical protein [Nocardiopsis sp. CC223A]|uniref:hypothetical protein n=1 Tax=Nocardiopsis sp. CC223A TaxID=3044051 RepID=UPI002795C82F|nr:hypothetical protein [Nocardiopsis sp. CC223A]
MSKRVRRYSENPPQARRGTPDLPLSRPRPNLAPPAAAFDAAEIPLVRRPWTATRRGVVHSLGISPGLPVGRSRPPHLGVVPPPGRRLWVTSPGVV